ncbi:hypothetical protein MTR_5g040970 [Medicago truncatula]|uniref:Uncharacterized protein n=1 Tax=Medicago truncatula TaxID=3880 RepID=G7KFA4_MEDTR|nr:hypothetical protein MTR_5g040970 [Medicago truncatula]
MTSLKESPRTLVLSFWLQFKMLLPKRHHQCFLEDFYKLGGCARRILKKKDDIWWFLAF